jgi:hypothetical protein
MASLRRKFNAQGALGLGAFVDHAGKPLRLPMDDDTFDRAILVAATASLTV